jgi:hypothetical protein
MTLTIALTDDQTAALTAMACARGLSLEEYARQVLVDYARRVVVHDGIDAKVGDELAPDWLQKSWESAKQAGFDRLSMEEIDAEIAAARSGMGVDPTLERARWG